jgi:ABC-2 type transport system permease protein/lipopolysaccharide transport system permease protein
VGTAAAVGIDGPPSELRFRRRLNIVGSTRELWRARELIRTLAERDYRVRYKQAFLGIAWAVLTPVALMVIFTLVFQKIAHVNHGEAHYALFAYLGLLPWTFFASSLNVGGLSLVSNVSVLNKVYCPREVFPIGSMLVAAADTAMSMIGLVVLFAAFQTLPDPTTVYVPLLMIVQVILTLGLTMFAAITIVYLRDLRYALPVILQFGLFATPVAYALSDIPASFRTLYEVLNPLAVIIDGYRRTVLFNQAPDWPMLGVATLVSSLIFILGSVAFKRLEGGIADVA